MHFFRLKFKFLFLEMMMLGRDVLFFND